MHHTSRAARHVSRTTRSATLDFPKGLTLILPKGIALSLS